MNLKKKLKEKNYFLRKAYEAAFDYAPSNPLSVNLDPIVFGSSIGFDDIQIERIMIELVDDGYIESSIGLRMLVVTKFGLQYLRKIEDEPLTAIEYNNIPLSSNISQTNTAIMRQSEKLDLILRELYKHKNDGKYYSIKSICESLNIPIDSVLEINRLSHRLKDDSYIKAEFRPDDCVAELTSYGIEYCEENSYTYAGKSIITNHYNISVTNSPNTNIVSQSTNVTINQSISAVNDAIEKIREEIKINKEIENIKATEILECLSEIQESIKNKQSAKYSIKALMGMAGDISSIASWIMVLGQFAGLIPTMGM